MFKEINMTPTTRLARGRNGFFNPKRMYVDYHGEACVYLQVLSRRNGKMAPILIPLGLIDALELGSTLIEFAKHSYREHEYEQNPETIQVCA